MLSVICAAAVAKVPVKLPVTVKLPDTVPPLKGKYPVVTKLSVA
jgi:hypothetical protein